MARFYSSISGSAPSEATRQGTADSGIEGHIRGWDMGISVTMYVDANTDEDVAIVHITGGSGGAARIFAFTVRDSEAAGIVIDEIGGALAAVVLEEEE